MIACDCFPCYKHDNINLVNFVINDLFKSKSAVLSAKTGVKISYPILVIAQTDLADKRERLCRRWVRYLTFINLKTYMFMHFILRHTNWEFSVALIWNLNDFFLQLANSQQAAFEEQEKRYLKKVLVEERSRYCMLATCFRPVVVSSYREVCCILGISHFFV